MSKEAHFIPEGLIGDIHIFFNKRDVLKRESLNDRRIYRIQNSGILKTHFKKNTGYTNNISSDLEFYYVKNGRKRELPLVIDLLNVQCELDSNTIIVYEY